MGGDQGLDEAWWETRYRERHTPWDRSAVSPALRVAARPRSCPGLRARARGGRACAPRFRRHRRRLAPSAVAFLRARLLSDGLRADVVQADLLEWEAARGFDAVYEQTSLCALPPSQWPAYAERLHGWLRADGSLFALFMQTGRADGPPFHCDIGAMRALFAERRWRWPSGPGLEVPHPAGFVEVGYVLQRAL